MASKPLIIGICLGICYWILAACIGSFIFHEGDLGSQLFSPGIYEVGARLIVISLIAALVLMIQKTRSRRRRTESRTKHLNNVLRAVRRLNNLIQNEREVESLIKKACECFVETQSYHAMWMTLLDDSRRVWAGAESGLNNTLSGIMEKLGRGELLTCWETAMSQSGVATFSGGAPGCDDCPLSCFEGDRGVMAVRMEHNSRMYGLLFASLPGHCLDDEEERAVFEEVGQNIAFALHGRESEEKRRHAEAALHISEKRYRGLFNGMLSGFALHEVICDEAGRPKDYRFLDVNPVFERISGFKREDVIGKRALEVFPEMESKWIEAFGQVAMTGRPVHFENYSKFMDRHFEVMAFSPSKGQFAVIYNDVTQPKRIGEALRRSEKQYYQLMETMNEGVVIEDRSGRITYVNEQFCTMMGFPRQRLISRQITEFLDEDNQNILTEQMKRRRKGERGAYEIVFNNVGGEKIYTIISPEPIFDPEGAFKGSFAVITDITQRRRAEAALRETEEKYRLLVEHANEAIFVIQDNVVKFPNPITLSMLGYSEEELSALPFESFIHPEDVDRVLERVEATRLGEEAPGTYSFRFLDREGEALWVQINAVPIRWEERRAVLVFLRDITPQRKLEDQLYRTQKMEAIGTLAGGIAHDFNNILAAILGHTELGLYTVSKGHRVRENLEQVLKAGHRAKELVKQILAFSRQSKEEKKPLQLSSVVKEALKLLRASLPTTIQIRRKIQNDSGTILADATQMHQVLMNLCSNAAHAMRDQNGILTVGLEAVDLTKEDAADHPDLEEGHYLKLTVSDSGHGMELSVLERIFDPYFTTKAACEGTGMGLAVVHGIIHNHGGGIRVDSRPGKGTTFQVFLPRVNQEVSDKTRIKGPIPGGTERILLVDDEAALAEVGKNILGRLGYSVVAETQPLNAREIFYMNPDSFDLVITDQTMPNMTGVELVKELMEIRRDIPVILCTGFSDAISEEQAVAMGIRAFVLKPIVSRQIAETIRGVLDEGVGSTNPGP